MHFYYSLLLSHRSNQLKIVYLPIYFKIVSHALGSHNPEVLGKFEWNSAKDKAVENGGCQRAAILHRPHCTKQNMK